MNKQKLLHFDVRTKLITMLLICVLVMSLKETSSLWLVIALMSFYLFLQGARAAVIKFICIAVVCKLILLTSVFAHISFFISFILIAIPMIMTGHAISLATPTEVIAAMQISKCPRILTLVVTFMFRFYPTIKHEFRQIRDAQKLRGIISIKKPMDSIEYTLIPMMMRSAKVSDELAAAAEVRGIDAPGQHTSLHDIKIKKADYIFLLVVLGFSALLLFIDRAGGLFL
ncbi:MAG: energy-coupling factor transporter transmembrane protein EcfT [Clostridia bacterium]|nr:energy-coupling factor transporter transmembrane protein EcfT [Clostridia bacterium]